MYIVINGERHECAEGITIAGLLNELGLAERRVAVEVNREIVPKSAHQDHALDEGDRIELVHAMGGG